MADIGEVAAAVEQDEEVADIPIYQKNGDPYLGADGSPSTVGVIGSESKEYNRALDKIARKGMRRGVPSAEETRDRRIDLAAAAVKRWSGWESGGKPFDFSPKNVKHLLGAQHILEQVEAGISRHADFFERGSPS
jgi:hypothetical protein